MYLFIHISHRIVDCCFVRQRQRQRQPTEASGVEVLHWFFDSGDGNVSTAAAVRWWFVGSYRTYKPVCTNTKRLKNNFPERLWGGNTFWWASFEKRARNNNFC